MHLGSSRFTTIVSEITLYKTATAAKSPVLELKSVTPQSLADAFAPSLAKKAGVTSPKVTGTSIPLTGAGDESVGVAIKLVTGNIEVHGHLVFFSQGNLLVNLTLIGPAGMFTGDTATLAQKASTKIREKGPR
jgi:hypothetical protein